MNVGDYCYIKGISRDYGIGRITQLNSGYSSNGGELIDIQFKHSKHSVPKRDVASSPNIIDLIEVGDYVNGVRVEEVLKKEDLCFIYLENGFDDVDNDYVLENGIVTKEQFESMEYKIQ